MDAPARGRGQRVPVQVPTPRGGNRHQSPPRAPEPPEGTSAPRPSPGLYHTRNAARNPCPLRGNSLRPTECRQPRQRPPHPRAFSPGPGPSAHGAHPTHSRTLPRPVPARRTPSRPSSHAVPTQGRSKAPVRAASRPGPGGPPAPHQRQRLVPAAPPPAARGHSRRTRCPTAGAFRTRDRIAGRGGVKEATVIG